MATVRISQLTAITAPTDDDVLIINDADTNTRKITFANLTQNLVNTTAATQTKSGALTVSGTLTAGSNFVVDTNTFFVDSVTNRVGVRTISPNTELDIDGAVHIRNSNTLQFGDANDSNFVSLGAPSVIASDFALTLPAALPTANNLLWSDGSGNLGFTAGITYDTGTQAIGVGGAWFTNQGSVRFYEQSLNGSDYVGFTAPANLSSTTGYTLPGTYPASSGFVLSSTTGGVLSWVSNAASAAGNAGDVQFSDGSALTANSNFNFDNGTQTLSLPNLVAGSNLTVNGSVQLGNASGDLVSVPGRISSSLTPASSGTYSLGSSVLHYGSAYVDDLYTYGNVELGDSAADAISINGVVDTNVIPDAGGTRNLGSVVQPWGILYVTDVISSGNVQIGDTSGDTLTLNAEITGDLIPKVTGTTDIGSASKRVQDVHVNQLFAYGSLQLGTTTSDVITLNASVQGHVIPGVGFYDLGSVASPWDGLFVNTTNVTSDADVGGNLTVDGNINHDARTLTKVSKGVSIATATSYDVVLGELAVYSSFKVLVTAVDVVTGDREFYEHFIVHDGSIVSEITGSNVQSPTPGVFLTSPASTLSGLDVVLSVTNTATSTNDLDICVQVTAFNI